MKSIVRRVSFYQDYIYLYVSIPIVCGDLRSSGSRAYTCVTCKHVNKIEYEKPANVFWLRVLFYSGHF